MMLRPLGNTAIKITPVAMGCWPITKELGKPLSEVVINWTIHRKGITAALCGAKRPEQIRETAVAMAWQLSPEQTTRIDAAIQNRGPIHSRAAV